MPNKTLVEILKRSVEEFNRWRYENPKEKIDLIGANLKGEHLNMANLENARLIGADLRHANLIETSLLNET